MKKFLVIGVALVLVAGGVYFFTARNQSVPVLDVPIVEKGIGAPVFAWSYSESEKDGIPYTEISLIAMYENGVSDKKVIDTVEGSCNAYEKADSDIYERSTMIICYYAGLGRYFKVLPNEDGYMVQRRMFEESSPDYDPPVQPYETIARF